MLAVVGSQNDVPLRFSNFRCYSQICGLPSIALMLTKLCHEYSSFQTLLRILLKWLIDNAVTKKTDGYGSRCYSLLKDLLSSVDMDDDVANLVTR
jgi:hypothetical protein